MQYLLGDAMCGHIIDTIVETMVAELSCALREGLQLGFDEKIDRGAEGGIPRGCRLGANASVDCNCEQDAEAYRHQAPTSLMTVFALHGDHSQTRLLAGPQYIRYSASRDECGPRLDSGLRINQHPARLFSRPSQKEIPHGF